MNPIIFWQTKWICAENICVREFNLRRRKLWVVHLAGDFAIKVGYFLCQQKAKTVGILQRLEANICLKRTVLAACSGLLQDALEYFRAQNLGGGLKMFWGAWKICSWKKDASKNGFSTSDLYNVSNKASFCVCLSKENWFSVKTRSVKQHRQPLYKSTTIEKSYVLYGLLHKYLRHNHVSITRLVAQRSSRMSEFDVKISITRQSFKEDFLFQE